MKYQFGVPMHRSIPQRLRLPVFMGLALILITLTISIVRFTLRADSLSDTTPMEFVSLDLASTTVDASAGLGEVGVTGEVFEDLSGYKTVYYHYTSPSGQQILEGDLNSNPPLIDTYIRFPQYSEEGVWRPTITLVDEASNSVTYTADELINLGFPMDITVTSTPSDTVAPELVDIDLDTPTIDTANGEATLTGTAVINESLSGLSRERSSIIFESPSSGQRTLGVLEHVSGSNYTFYAFFRQYTEVGNWNISVELKDVTSNTSFYDNTEMGTLNFPTTVAVTGNQDVTPITIENMNFSAAFPPVPDIYPNSSKVTIYAELSDNLSGVNAADIVYKSQTTNQIAEVATVNAGGGVYQYTIFLPPYAASGQWLPEVITSDQAGNTVTLNYTDLANLGFDMSLEVVKSETETVIENSTVTTDTQNNGATATDQFEASVTTPVAGEVKITQVSLTDPVSSNDYLVYDQQYDIEAPEATVENPLVLRFRIDQSGLQGQTAATVSIFRNGSLVAECTDPNQAIPAPCVAERNTLGDGDVEIVVRTDHASIWTLGYAAPTGPAYTFKHFKGINPMPFLNSAKAGSSVNIKFNLGGDFGLGVLPAGIATSQEINCSSKGEIGDAIAINTNNNGLRVSDDEENEDVYYKFNWKTLKNWKNSCRKITLDFSNGEVVEAYFEFK